MRGFTLIETLVYLALFALIIGGFVAASYMLFETSDRNQTKAMMQEEENFLIGKINYALSGAQVITTPAQPILPAKVTTSASLVVTTNTIDLLNGKVRLNPNPISNDNVTVKNLLFIRTFAGGTNPESIEAGFTISAKTSAGATVSETASTTRYLRK